MRESLFSPLWHRYANQRPQLRSHVSVQSQRYRDQVWHLLINNTKETHFRVNHIAYHFIGRCDGRYTVQEVWDSLLEILHDDAPTQDEVIQLLTELDQRDLIRFEVSPNISTMYRKKRETKKRQIMSLINPLAFRVPLWNPTKFLDHTSLLQKLTFNSFVFILWLVIVTFGFFGAAANWQTLSHHASTYMMTTHYLLLTWLSFPFIKFLHELGHALAVRHWGGQVSETGITFFMLTPAPYVDASASSAFQSKFQRVLVSAIGIMVELFLATLALYIWLNTQAGLVHDIAFVTMFICSVSSLLFNGNPLLRFDAYYVLSDLFELPNLATRSKQYWVNMFKKITLGAKNVSPMSLATGEEKWLIAYAPLSLIYILSIISYIIFWVGQKSVVLGLLITTFTTLTILIIPLYRTIKSTLSAAEAGNKKFRVEKLLSMTMLAFMVLLFIVPFPLSKTAQGIIWTPEKSQVRPKTEGFINKILVDHGNYVEKNQVILTLQDNNLIAARESLISQLAGLQADQYNLIFQDPARANNVTEQIEKKVVELSHIEERISALTIRSQIAGRLVMPHQEDVIGTFIERGAILGYILNKDIIKVRAVMPESDTALVHDRLQQVEVRTTADPMRTIVARMVMDTPAVTHTLPSAALGNTGGGLYITDPSDKGGLTSLEPLVSVDLTLPKTELERVGGRVNVRFNLGLEPIGMQMKRHLSQLFLRYFNPNE